MKRVFYFDINEYKRKVPRESRGCQFSRLNALVIAMQNIVFLNLYEKYIERILL